MYSPYSRLRARLQQYSTTGCKSVPYRLQVDKPSPMYCSAYLHMLTGYAGRLLQYLVTVLAGSLF